MSQESPPSPERDKQPEEHREPMDPEVIAMIKDTEELMGLARRGINPDDGLPPGPLVGISPEAHQAAMDLYQKTLRDRGDAPPLTESEEVARWMANNSIHDQT